MEEVSSDVLEQILVRLDVKDLIRCKSVCKSWQSFISSPCFVNVHLKHSYKNDRDNPELGHRRIATSDFQGEELLYFNKIYIVGSCNGLVCFSPRDAEIVVTNPSTREHRKLQTLPYNPRIRSVRRVVSWGFGYDSSADDYKVIVGVRNIFRRLRTLFYALTLRSNIWKVIGEVKYRRLGSSVNGVLCGGALHWFMSDAKKRVIMSIDLSTEEFKEIPQPEDGDYKSHAEHQYCHEDVERRCDEYVLGVLEECLCIYTWDSPLSSTKKWVMKNNKWEIYNNNNNDCTSVSKYEEWELYDDDHHDDNGCTCEGRHDIVHDLIPVGGSKKKTTTVVYGHDDGKRLSSVRDNIGASIFVKSLVSPHLHANNNNYTTRGQKRKAMAIKQQEQQANKRVEKGNIITTRKCKHMRGKRPCKHKKPLIWI